jgi:hypothetical protein
MACQQSDYLHQGDGLDSESFEPLLEPFLEDPSNALEILAADNRAIQKAKTCLVEKRRNDSDFSVPSSSELPVVGNYAASKDTPLKCFTNPQYSPMEGAESRAISLRQLRLVVEYIYLHADSEGYLPWTDWNQNSATYGLKLHIDIVNLYHVVDWVIKPVTQEFKCSLVEILSSSRQQRPRWFVSHVWCEPVKNFLSSVEEHARIRGLSEEDFWWVLRLRQ